MAKIDLAAQWLNENDPNRQKAQQKRVICHKRVARSRKTYFAAFDEWTEQAIVEQRAREKELRGVTFGDGFDGRSDFVRRFVHSNQNFSGAQCLLVPFASKADRIILPNYGPIAAAAYMCRLAHGAPEADWVARHLCGNGHMSCVNPRHLAWGTNAENQNDYRLHTQRPHVWPVLTDEAITQILECDLPHTVTAIHYQIHALLVEALRSGRCPKHYKRKRT